MGIVREGVTGQVLPGCSADSGTRVHAGGTAGNILGINIDRGVKKGLNRGRSWTAKWFYRNIRA